MSQEKTLQQLSMDRITAAVQAYGRQKVLAADLDMNDVELSRLLSDQVPKLCKLLDRLQLQVCEAGHIRDLRKVLKEVL